MAKTTIIKIACDGHKKFRWLILIIGNGTWYKRFLLKIDSDKVCDFHKCSLKKKNEDESKHVLNLHVYVTHYICMFHKEEKPSN